MPMQPFNPEAKTRAELMESRSRQFIALDARATKGQLANPLLTREERELVKQFDEINRDLSRKEIDEPTTMDKPW